jgi:hypothetical protein
VRGCFSFFAEFINLVIHSSVWCRKGSGVFAIEKFSTWVRWLDENRETCSLNVLHNLTLKPSHPAKLHFSRRLIQSDLQDQLGLSALLKGTMIAFSPRRLWDSNRQPFCYCSNTTRLLVNGIDQDVTFNNMHRNGVTAHSPLSVWSLSLGCQGACGTLPALSLSLIYFSVTGHGWIIIPYTLMDWPQPSSS